MGELIDYYIVLSTIMYDNDPLKFGRIKCQIPGVIHTDTTDEEAMPWVRPLKMHGYQTFSRPLVGQKVWVLISKSNYNEFWWFPFHETSDLVQSYLDENYDNQPDVFNARSTASGDVMFSYDVENGYLMRIGEDYINLNSSREATIACDKARMMIRGSKTYCGAGDDTGGYEPCVMGDKCEQLRIKLSQDFMALKTAAESMSYLTGHLAPAIDLLKTHITENIKCQNHFVN